MGTGLCDRAYGTATDGSGNIYITGITLGGLDGNINAGDSDIFLAKFDSAGTQCWIRQIGTDKKDEGQYLEIDNSGNIYITGSTKGNIESKNRGKKDAFLLKYDTNGNLIFRQQFGTSESDIGKGISFDKSGNIYLCGIVGGDWDEPNIDNMDPFLAKFNQNGKLLWKKTYGTKQFDTAANIKIDMYIPGCPPRPEAIIYAILKFIL